jgi:hypothetical protein
MMASQSDIQPNEGRSQPIIQYAHSAKGTLPSSQAPSLKRRSHAIPIVDPRSVFNTQEETLIKEELSLKVTIN